MRTEQIRQFIEQGFIRIDQAFPRELADEGRAILWKDTGCDPNDPRTWTRPVIRLNQYGQVPFRKAVNSPILRAAYDDLVGKGRWEERLALGTFPIPREGQQFKIDTAFPLENLTR